MAGQLWSNTGQGFMSTDILSEDFRLASQPIARYRQFCDVEDAVGKHRGQTYTWDVFGDTATAGGALTEGNKMPETSFPVGQGSIEMTEYGNSVPFSLKYDELSALPVRKIINKTLKNDATRTFDRAAHAQFDATILQAVGGASGAITLTDNGTASGVNAQDLTKEHVRTIAVTMEERNIPVFDGEDYMAVARPTTLQPLMVELEDVHKYVDEGWKQIVNGECGRYAGVRFAKQTNVADEGWTNNSDAAYFFGADTVTEAIAIPEELRGKIPDDYGRGKGLAWFYIGGFGITHADETSAATKAQARIVKWASTS